MSFDIYSFLFQIELTVFSCTEILPSGHNAILIYQFYTFIASISTIVNSIMKFAQWQTYTSTDHSAIKEIRFSVTASRNPYSSRLKAYKFMEVISDFRTFK